MLMEGKVLLRACRIQGRARQGKYSEDSEGEGFKSSGSSLGVLTVTRITIIWGR